jgi:hypothetical protein
MLPECHGPIWAIDDVSRCFQRKYVSSAHLFLQLAKNYLGLTHFELIQISATYISISSMRPLLIVYRTPRCPSLRCEKEGNRLHGPRER